MRIIGFMAQIMKVIPLQTYVCKVTTARTETDPHVLSDDNPNDTSILQYIEIAKCLSKDGRDTTGIKPTKV